MQTRIPALSLGPVYFLWDGPKWRDFYFRIADEASIDHVTLGETVCSKRQHFSEPHIGEVVERLEAAGKRVTLSTLAMVTLERESRHVRDLVAASEHPVEANDLSALWLLKGRPHSIGPLVNVYNAATARLLAARGRTISACRRNCRRRRSWRCWRRCRIFPSSFSPSAACHSPFPPAAPMPAPRD